MDSQLARDVRDLAQDLLEVTDDLMAGASERLSVQDVATLIGLRVRARLVLAQTEPPVEYDARLAALRIERWGRVR